MCLHYDNAPCHNSNLVKNWVSSIEEDQIYRIVHPPHSPDLSPTDFYLFRSFSQFTKNTLFLGPFDMDQKIRQWFIGKKFKILIFS